MKCGKEACRQKKTMPEFFACSWCSHDEPFETVDTLVYFDHAARLDDPSTAHICSQCQELYDLFVSSRDDK